MSTILEYLVKTAFDGKGVDSARREIQEFDREAERVNDNEKRRGRDSEDRWSKIGAGIASAAAAYISLRTAQQAWQQLEAGADLLRLETQFNTLTASIGASAGMMDRLREATRNTVADSDLMSSANEIISLGLADTEEQVTRLTTVIGGLGLNMQQVILTMANDSKMRLDALGLSVEDVTARVEELNAAGFEGDAFDEAVLLALEERYGLLAGSIDDAALSIDQLQAVAQNARDSFQEGFATSLTEELYAAAGGALALGTELQNVARWLGIIIGGTIGEGAGAVSGFGGMFSPFGQAVESGSIAPLAATSGYTAGFMSLLPSGAYGFLNQMWQTMFNSQPSGDPSTLPPIPQAVPPSNFGFGPGATGFSALGYQFGQMAPEIPITPRWVFEGIGGGSGPGFADSVPGAVVAAEAQAALQRELDAAEAIELRIAEVNLAIDRFEMAEGVTPEDAAEQLFERFEDAALDLARGQESTRLFDAFIDAARNIAPELAEELQFQLDFSQQIGEVEKLAGALGQLSGSQAASVFDAIASGASNAAGAIRGLADALREQRDTAPGLSSDDIIFDENGDPLGPSGQTAWQSRQEVAVRLTAEANSLDALAEEIEAEQPTITAMIEADDGPIADVFSNWDGRTVTWNVTVNDSAATGGGGGGGGLPDGADTPFASGGWTGSGSPTQPAGIVHRGEVVVPADVLAAGAGAVNRFVDNAYPGGLSGGGATIINNIQAPDERSLYLAAALVSQNMRDRMTTWTGR